MSAAGFEGAQPHALIVVLVWLLGGSQRQRTAAPQLCTLCEHAVLANLVNPIKLGGSARLRGWFPGVGVVLQYKRRFTDHGLQYL